MSYAEHLFIPSIPAEGPATPAPVSLLRSFAPQVARLHLDAEQGSDRLYDAAAQHEARVAAAHVSRVMRGIDGNRPSSTTEATVYLSECLDEGGINHTIGFANNRAFAAVPTWQENGAGRSLYFVDPLEPAAHILVNSAIYRGTVHSALKEVAITPHRRATVMLDTSLLAISHPDHPLIPDIRAETGVFERGSREQHRAYGVPLSLFASHIGRNILNDLGGFRASIAGRDWQGACYFLSAISGKFPDIDARSPHSEIQRLLKGLREEGNLSAASRAHHDYWSSFYMTDHPRLRAMRVKQAALTQTV